MSDRVAKAEAAPKSADQSFSSYLSIVAPWVACLAAIGAIIYTTMSWHDWTSSARFQSTENAYVKSDPAVLSARVSGYIHHLPVADYQAVKAGDIIAEIASEDYQIDVKVAEATLIKAQSILDNLRNEQAQQQAVIAQAEATLQGADTRLSQYRQDFERKQKLVKSGAISQKVIDDTNADLNAAKATREAALAAVTLAKRQLDVLEGERGKRMADRDAAAASLASAESQLNYTKIVAPFDGKLGRRHVQIGSLVSSGTQIVTLVPLTRPYVMANFKETQLKNVHSGLPVEIKVDALPNVRFRGRIEQIAPMSGAETAVIPTDNAMGNFTKVVQRIPVRVDLEPDQVNLSFLKAGMSTRVRIDTQGEEILAYRRDKIGIEQEELADAH